MPLKKKRPGRNTKEKQVRENTDKMLSYTYKKRKECYEQLCKQKGQTGELTDCRKYL